MRTYSYPTKPGQHGTLYRYSIEYTDDDPNFGTERWSCWAYSEEHAVEKFYDSPEGFIPKRIARQRVNNERDILPASSWKWHAI